MLYHNHTQFPCCYCCCFTNTSQQKLYFSLIIDFPSPYARFSRFVCVCCCVSRFNYNNGVHFETYAHNSDVRQIFSTHTHTGELNTDQIQIKIFFLFVFDIFHTITRLHFSYHEDRVHFLDDAFKIDIIN